VIFIGKEPPNPETVITIYDTGGAMGNPDASMFDPVIQIRVRAHSYADAMEKSEQVRDELVLNRSRIIGDFLYTGFWLISDVAGIGRDDNDRELFTTNYRLMREPYITA
jgi:hypothetical protein